jgi:hypothetical protein
MIVNPRKTRFKALINVILASNRKVVNSGHLQFTNRYFKASLWSGKARANSDRERGDGGSMAMELDTRLSHGIGEDKDGVLHPLQNSHHVISVTRNER